MCSIDDMDQWGPVSDQPHCGGFTFTLLFEEVYMSMLPASLLIITACTRIAWLWRRRVQNRPSLGYFLKMGVFASLAGLQIAHACTLNRKNRTRASLAASLVGLSSTVTCIILSSFENFRSSSPSDVLVGYYTLSTCLDAVTLSTLWRGLPNEVPTALFTAAVALRLVVLVLESWPKGKSQQGEANRNIISRGLLWWVNSLMNKGFRTPLSFKTLILFDKRLSAVYGWTEIQQSWNKLNLGTKLSLFTTCIRDHWTTVLWGTLLRLCAVGFKFVQPELVKKLVGYGGRGGSSPGSASGPWLVLSYAIVYIGIAITQCGSNHQTNRLIIQARTYLISVLFKESLASVDSTGGSDMDAAELTLISADAEKVVHGLQTVHNLWAGIIEIGISVWLLQRLLHLATVGSTLICIMCVVAGGFIAANAARDQGAWLQAVQKRVDLTAAFLRNYKHIKLSAVDDVVFRMIADLRKDEVQISKAYRRQLIYMITTSYLSYVAAIILGYAVFVLSSTVNKGRQLDSETAFSALTIFLLLTQAVSDVVIASLGFMVALGSFERYRTHLEMLHKSRPRTWQGDDPAVCSKTADNSEHIVLGNLESVQPSEESKDVCVVAHSANIGWHGSPPVLTDVSFTIRKGQFAFISGMTNSGKSTLVKSLLGLNEVSKGRLWTGFTIAAYCSQQPWLVNTTVIRNIIGNLAFEKAWFKTVIEACCLQEDIEGFPNHGNSEVGPDGIRLSGGQRARMALARAVYSRIDVLLLDDVFVGLDPQTAHKIVQSLLGKEGLLRKMRATVILATSADAFRPYFDCLIDIGPPVTTTTVEPQRNEELQGLESLHCRSSRPSTSKDNRSYHSIASTVSNSPDAQGADLDPRSGYVGEYRSDSAMVENMPNTLDIPETQIEQLSSSRTDSDASVYWYYIKVANRHNSAIFLCLCSVFVFALSFPQIWLASWTNAIESGSGHSTALYLGIYCLLGVIAIGSLILGGICLMVRMVPESALVLHASLLDTIKNAPASHLMSRDTGELINRFSQDLSIIDTDVPMGVFQTIFTSLSCVVQAVFMCLSSKYTAAGIPVCLAVLYALQQVYLRTSRRLRILEIEARAPLMAHFLSTLRGRSTIRSLGWTTSYIDQCLQLLDTAHSALYLLFSVQQWLSLVLGLMVAAIATALAIVSVRLGNESSSGFVGVVMTGLVTFSAYLSNLVTSWTALETAIQALLRVKKFEEDTPRKIDQAQQGALDWLEKGAVEFERVFASYSNGFPVLRGVSLYVRPGEKIGLCGRTGSGKSSLLSALSRFIPLDSGTIRIDNMDITSVPESSLCARILSISQEPFLLPGSIRTNVDPQGSLTDELIVSVLKEVGLWDQLNFRGGLDAIATETLVSLSERQLLCFARILKLNAPIVLLDEVTSSLDQESGDLVRQLIREAFYGRTLFVVAHSVQDLLECDRVVVLQDGEIVEVDTPAKLYDNPNSRFRLIFQSEFERKR